MIQKIKASDFSKREELENYVRGSTGLTADMKANVQIEGTRAELELLGLSDATLFWGIKCVITDTPTVAKKQSEVERPERGEKHESGLNKDIN